MLWKNPIPANIQNKHIYMYIYEAIGFVHMATFDWFRKFKNSWISLLWNDKALHQSGFG